MPARKKYIAETDSEYGDSSTVRASISFDRDDYEQLEALASERHVSLAWMVREAVRVYLKSQPGGPKAGKR